jgi:alpha-tubulin suppressor-like RCC1 family protein
MSPRISRLRALAAAALLLAASACDDLLVRPTPGPARLSVGVTPGALRAASQGVANAFNAADAVRVLLIPAPDSMYDGQRGPPSTADIEGDPAELAVLDVTLPFTPADSTALSVEVPPVLLVADSATAFVIYALMDGPRPLFFGLNVVRIRRGETATALADTLFASAVRIDVSPPETLEPGMAVKLDVRTFFTTGDTVPAPDAILSVYALDATIVETEIDPETNSPLVRGLRAGTTRVVVEAFGVGDPPADTVDVTVEDPAPVEFPGDRVWAGQNHTCTIRGGQPWCWGSGSRGALGNGTIFLTNHPVPALTGGKFFQTLSLGNVHTCGITSPERALYCWGANESGQLGIGAAGADQLSPTAVSAPAGKRWSHVDAGEMATCAVAEADSLAYCWGKDLRGRLGLSGSAQAAPLTPVNGGFRFREVEVGLTFACGIEATLSVVKCWGASDAGVLGDSLRGDSDTPGPINAPVTFVDLSVGPQHACAVDTDGGVWCWGSNLNGEMGTADLASSHRDPTLVPMVGTAVAVEAGFGHTCALEDTGDVVCWGRNDLGQVGVGFTAPVTGPTLVADPGEVAQVATGYRHSCAAARGKIYCWGDGNSGQLGNLSFEMKLLPTPVLIPAHLAPPGTTPAGRRTTFRISLRPARTAPGAGR